MTLRLSRALPVVSAAALAAGVVTATSARSQPPDPLAGIAHSSAQADRQAVVILDRAYVLGAVRVAGPSSFPASSAQDHEVQHRRWYTVVGTLDAVMGRMSATPPPGFGPGYRLFHESSSSGDATGAVFMFVPPGQSDSGKYSLDVAAIDLGNGRVSLRLDATVSWALASAPQHRIDELP